MGIYYLALNELGLIGGLMEEDPTGYDGVLGCYLRFLVTVSYIDVKGLKAPPTLDIYAICPLEVTRPSILSSQSHFIFCSSHSHISHSFPASRTPSKHACLSTCCLDCGLRSLCLRRPNRLWKVSKYVFMLSTKGHL